MNPTCEDPQRVTGLSLATISTFHDGGNVRSENRQALEGPVDDGHVAHLGTSNSTIPELRLLLADARVLPSLHEVELHPSFQQEELFAFCREHGIQPVGYSPLGSPSRPERDRTPEDVVDTDLPVVREITAAHGIHPVLVCLKRAVQRGQVPLPFAVEPTQYETDRAAVVEDPLTPEEMEALRSAERGNRLIEGQVFLWPGAESWHDLWDLDGTTRLLEGVPQC